MRRSRVRSAALSAAALGGLVWLVTPVAAQTIITTDTTISGNIDGNGGGGYMVMDGTLTVNNATLSNFLTKGGDGSGGGAGMGGAIFINDGATVLLNNVNILNNIALGGQGGAVDGSGDAITTGGSLNSLTGTSGSNGSAGDNGDGAGAYVNGGNGLPGMNGFNGGNGTAGAGGKGGDGGDGGDGSATTADIVNTIAEQAKAIFDAAGDSTEAGLFTTLATAFGAASAAAAVGGVNAAGPAPNVPLSTALATVAAQMTLLAAEATASAGGEGTKAAYELAYLTAIQITSYATGAAGNGGGAGNGAKGGNGSLGYGGGGGGDGGDGGDAVSVSAAIGGAGGNGGTGGTGGFGAGGGQGGNGGSAGSDGIDASHGPADGAGGGGGRAGFGGGEGSTGSGDSVAEVLGGGGGAGLGGGIFVRDGGTLHITGDSVFGGNSAWAGGSYNNGAAGDQAGTDIFMMSGSTVIFDAGEGHVIEVNGGGGLSISDTTKPKDYGGANEGMLDGAGIEVRSGLTILNGANTYSGETYLSGGVLRANEGEGLSSFSNVNFDGGVLETSGDFNRFLGILPERVQWTGSGGFSAIGDDLNVRLNAGSGLTWGAGNFVGSGDSLLFGSDFTDADVHFANAINLANGTRTIIANSGADGEGRAYLDGVLSNGSLVLGDGTTVGTIVLSKANTYSGSTVVMDGTTLMLAEAGSVGSSSGLTVDGGLDISEAAGGISIVTLLGGGDVNLGANTLTVTNASTTFSGGIAGAGGFTVAGGSQGLSGANTYTGRTIIANGAELFLTGAGDISGSSGVTAHGEFDIAGLTAAGTTIQELDGAATGQVVLGSKVLTIADADGLYAGIITGSGGVVIGAGEQQLSGTNSYTGETTIDPGAKLSLIGGGAIAASSKLTANGEFDISGTTAGASITTLAGSGSVAMGTRDLTISNGSTTFSGIVGGSGKFTVAGGSQTLSGVNTMTGEVDVDSGAALLLIGTGSIAAALGSTVDGNFDISGTTSGATVADMVGLASGTVTLGSRTLTIADANGTFAGVISGAGGVVVSDGIQTFSGANTYGGETTVAADAELVLTGAGGIANSSKLALAGTFDIAGTTSGAAIKDLSGLGDIVLGAKTLSVTAAASTFGGSVSGTGDFAVTGGTLTLENAALGVALAAANGATVLANSSEIRTGSTRPALNILNGGTITTTNTVLETAGPLAYANFDEAGKVANFTLGTGTVIDAHGGTLLLVERSGVGSDGIVNFILGVGVQTIGDILDQGAKTGNGGTDVTISADATWSGFVDAASFLVKTGGSADFEDGSKIDGNLTAEAGAIIFGGAVTAPLQVTGDAIVENGALTGNIYIQGDLNLSGLISPGASPGIITVGGNLNALTDAESLFEVRFGEANPLPGIGDDYDQLNIGGNVNGTLPVYLARWQSAQDTPLGNLDAIELIRVGGTESDGFVLGERFVQYGHEIRLERRFVAASDVDLVPNTALTESAFFGPGDMIVYGLEAIVQDETYALATLTGTAHQAIRDTLGTYVERRGPADAALRQASWLRAGGNYTEVADTVSNNQILGYAQLGGDLVAVGDFRAGLLGSYSTSYSDVFTETGTDLLTGALYAGGVHASWASGGVYIEAVGQYGISDWSFTPTAASNMTVTGTNLTAAVEAGLGFGSDTATFTPWGQFVYQYSVFDNVQSDWVGDAELTDNESMQLRGGLRAAGNFGGFAPYADVAVSHDFAEVKSVTVDGFDFATGMGGTRVEVGAGFQANLATNVVVSTDFKGAYGVGHGQVVAYQGQAGLKASW